MGTNCGVDKGTKGEWGSCCRAGGETFVHFPLSQV